MNLRPRPPYVLIADASPGPAAAASQLVRKLTLELVIVAGGEAAIDVWHARGLPRLAIINPVLHGLDGFAVVAELRKLATAEAVPVVMVSSDSALRERALRLRERFGIAAVIAPASDLVAEAVRDALDLAELDVTIDLDDPGDESVREEARLAELERLADPRRC